MARRPDPAAIATAQREGALGGLCARLRLSRATVDGYVARWAIEAEPRGLRVDDYRYCGAVLGVDRRATKGPGTLGVGGAGAALYG